MNSSDNTATPSPDKKTWLIILGSLAASALIYGLLAHLIQNSPQPRVISAQLPQMRVLVTIAAVGALGASMAWLHFTTQGKMGASGAALMRPGEFQTQSIVAMALAEACSICGLLLFFLGNTLTQFAPYIAGTLLVFFAVILPTGLRYWAAWEKSQQLRAPSAFEEL